MRTALLAALLTGCAAGAQGEARSLARAELGDPGWIAVVGVPEIRQEREIDCGPAAAAMLLGFWGYATDAVELRVASGTPRSSGVQAGTLRDLLRMRGFDASLVEGTIQDLERELGAGRPVVVGLAKPDSNGVYAHYAVVAGVNHARGLIAMVDPGSGWTRNSFAGFLSEWQPTHNLMLVVSPPATPADPDDESGPTGLTLRP
jgi:ABC-type bacteriocin/lantibiotic exporter with double-glycine peptidase domain